MSAALSAGRRVDREVEVLVVGAGPSGLAAAAHLADAGLDVEVLERELEPGGVPRHSDHLGYGLRDLRRMLTGPAYARAWTNRAVQAGAVVRTGASATGWAGPLSLDVTSCEGLERLSARAVVLATGARERPRSARGVPGDRPAAGVFTTGHLQQAVRAGQRIGSRAVIVGAEHVSYSAFLTLSRASVHVVALVSEHDRAQPFPGLAWAATLASAVPVLSRTEVTGLVGRRTLEQVMVRHADGRTAGIPADVVVFTGDWVAEHELARATGVAVAGGAKAPVVDTHLRTGVPGLFAAGNLVHPVHTADVAALTGSFVGQEVLEFLGGAQRWPLAGVDVLAGSPLRWIAPSRITADRRPPPRGRFTVWSAEVVPSCEVRISQGERVLARLPRRRGLVPGRAIDLAADWLDDVDVDGPAVTVEVLR